HGVDDRKGKTRLGQVGDGFTDRTAGLRHDHDAVDLPRGQDLQQRAFLLGVVVVAAQKDAVPVPAERVFDAFHGRRVRAAVDVGGQHADDVRAPADEAAGDLVRRVVQLAYRPVDAIACGG